MGFWWVEMEEFREGDRVVNGGCSVNVIYGDKEPHLISWFVFCVGQFSHVGTFCVIIFLYFFALST